MINNKLQHNQRFDELTIYFNGVCVNLKNVVVWIDECAYDFAIYGENIPTLSILHGFFNKYTFINETKIRFS